MAVKFKKNKNRHLKLDNSGRLFSVIVGILLLIPLGFLFFSNWKVSQKRAALGAELEVLQKRAEALEQRKKQLESQVSSSSQEFFLEKTIREQGYKKPGEEVAVVLAPEELETGKRESKSVLQQILEKLKFW